MTALPPHPAGRKEVARPDRAVPVVPGKVPPEKPPRWGMAVDLFPFGLAPFIILCLTVISGVYLLAAHLIAPPGETDASLEVWTFANVHADAYREAMPSWLAKHPEHPIDIQLVHADAVTRRLRAAFWADRDVPDVVEVEITRAGSFFRGPVEDVGFVDLTPRLKAPDPANPENRPLIDRIVQTRLAPYTNRGRIFGLPHDVHPVMLAYRNDLFEELGIDAAKLETWDDFIREGRRVTNLRDRYMLNLAKGAAHSAEVLLFQRDGEEGMRAGFFDEHGELILDNELAVRTLLWYCPLVAGPARIAADPGMFGPSFIRALQDGYTLAFICPDWKSAGVEKNAPQLAGKMKLMPLPAHRKGGRRTSTWGGTMLGITKKCDDKDLAWTLGQHLYMNPDDLGARFRVLNIIPPFKDAWTHPAFHKPRPFWSGQQIGTEYLALAEQVPPQYGSPFLELAKSKLGEVVAACVTYYDENGEAGFEVFVRDRLKQAADEVRRQMTRNPF